MTESPQASSPTSDETERIAALKEIEDEGRLAEIAIEDTSENVRLAALHRVTNPHSLMRIIKDGKVSATRVLATQKLQDQRLLAEILREVADEDIIEAAFGGLSDDRILADIARDSSFSVSVRRIAIDNFADQSFVQELARSVVTPDVKKAAMERLAQVGPAGEGSASVVPGEPDAVSDNQRIEAILDHYGSDRVVDAIGKFRGSHKALRSLGAIARKGDSGSKKAIHYLERALKHPNPSVRMWALEEVAGAVPGDRLAAIRETLMNDPDDAVKKAAQQLNG